MTIRTEIADGVAVLTLDDPDRRNALTLDMVDEIVAAFDGFEAEDSGVGAVIVTGAPPAFCAGADLSNLQASGDEARERAGGDDNRGGGDDGDDNGGDDNRGGDNRGGGDDAAGREGGMR